MCVCLCVQLSPFYKDTGHIGLGAHVTQYDLILTNHICKDPIANKVLIRYHILR